MADISKEVTDVDQRNPETNPVYSSSQESLHGINEKSLLRKLDYKLLPALTLLYLLSFLDRSNVGNARIEGLTADLHMTGNEYLSGLTLFFVGYVIVEVPCQVILKLWTPRMWLPTLTLAWGVVSTLMGVTQNKAGFFAVRFFLGVSESGLFPGIVVCLLEISSRPLSLALTYCRTCVEPLLRSLQVLLILMVQEGGEALPRRAVL